MDLHANLKNSKVRFRASSILVEFGCTFKFRSIWDISSASLLQVKPKNIYKFIIISIPKFYSFFPSRSQFATCSEGNYEQWESTSERERGWRRPELIVGYGFALGRGDLGSWILGLKWRRIGLEKIYGSKREKEKKVWKFLNFLNLMGQCIIFPFFKCVANSTRSIILFIYF